jgi:hypothetical protein
MSNLTAEVSLLKLRLNSFLIINNTLQYKIKGFEGMSFDRYLKHQAGRRSCLVKLLKDEKIAF